MSIVTRSMKGFILLCAINTGYTAPITTADEQRELIGNLSGLTEIKQRYSDSPDIQLTAAYLKSQYEIAGIHAEILQYNPALAFPWYFSSTNDTYRTYFKHLTPQFQAEFNGLCDDTLTPEQNSMVLKRLSRVGLDKDTLCKTDKGARVELYISTTIQYSTNSTKKMLAERTLPTWPNVIAYVPTSNQHNPLRPLCIIGAHMDSVARDGSEHGSVVSPTVIAPGADDNASGTAAVLTLARALKQHLAASKNPDPGCDLAFVHFSGEEEGLLGSIAFTHLQVTRPIKWMINFDMIGFNGSSNTPVFNVGYDNEFGTALPTAFHAPGVQTVAVERNTFIYSSDQIAFWDIHVPAISINEQACSESSCLDAFNYFNPNLHSPDDTADKLDFNYSAAIINQSFDGILNLLGDHKDFS